MSQCLNYYLWTSKVFYMPAFSLRIIESPKSTIATDSVQDRRLLIKKEIQKKKLVIPRSSLDTSLDRVFLNIDRRDSIIAKKKALRTKILKTQTVEKDTLWNIYTGNPGLYSTEGDTVAFGNVQYLPDSLFLKNLQVTEKPNRIYGFEGKVLNYQSQEWILGIILLLWIIFASIRSMFNTYIGKVFKAVVNVSTAAHLYSERGYKSFYGAVRLDIIFYLILPLSIFQILHYYKVDLYGYPDVFFYVILLIGINLYFLLKNFFYRLIGSILMIREKIDESIFHTRIYYKVLGIILLPVVTIHIAMDKFADISVMLMAGLILLFYLASVFRSIYIGFNKGISIFYLILYLCMLEVFPLILIFKILAGK